LIREKNWSEKMSVKIFIALQKSSVFLGKSEWFSKECLGSTVAFRQNCAGERQIYVENLEKYKFSGRYLGRFHA